MDPLVLIGALAIIAAGIGVAVWRLRGRSPESVEAPASREARAAALGWNYEAAPDGESHFTLKGEDSGVKWKLSYRSGSIDAGERPTLTWATRSVQGSATELRLIGRERYERGKANIEPIRERLSSSLILSAREIADAQERTAFIERTTPAQVGSERFRSAFAVIARNQRLARALLDTATESLITDWPARTVADPAAAVSVWIDWKGLRIDVETPNASMDTIEHLVRVGLALAGRYRRHATTPGVTVFMTTQPGPSQV